MRREAAENTREAKIPAQFNMTAKPGERHCNGRTQADQANMQVKFVKLNSRLRPGAKKIAKIMSQLPFGYA
jgi:hypothetical protein